MRRLALLLAFLAAACGEPPPPPSSPPSPTVYGLSNGALLGCKTWGFETICRRG